MSSAASNTVFVVDDDEPMRKSLEFLLESVNLNVKSFGSAQDFLDAYDPTEPGCLLLDVRMPVMSGLELQEKLREKGMKVAVIMMTAFADVPMAVRAMHQGAVDFIQKPFNEQALLECVQRALDRDAQTRKGKESTQAIEQRIETLTRREREVMHLVVQGKSNKQIASSLNLSAKTVEQHRSKAMEKMDADSLAALVRMAVEVGFV